MAERTRRRPAPPAVRPPVDAVSAVLARQAKARDRELARALAASPRWPAQAVLRRSVPGVGPVLTATPTAGRPELGRLDRKRIAALVGVAPLARDRGTQRGPRRIWGGRAPGRAVRSMATLRATGVNPVSRAGSQRLRAAGKPKKVALTACRRKLLLILNALRRDGTTWEEAKHHGSPP